MKKRRTLPAGDPSKFVWWRWMAIEDPTTGDLYLDRLYIFRTPIGGLMLHKIIGPDWGRDLHSHPWRLGPWSFLAVVLRGGYIEEAAWIPDSSAHTLEIFKRERKAWKPFAFRQDQVHRIAETKPGTLTLCWSFPKPKARTWGFWVHDKGIVKWSAYLDEYGRDGAR